MIRDYQEAVEFLYSSLPMFQRQGASAYKNDLSVSEALDFYDGSQHRNYITLHVAGTNGKGSVSHMLASILQVAGYRVGLYTSPHMLDYRERIRVNGEMITPDYVVNYLQGHEEIIEELSPSFFELTTAMAFSYFNDCQVDIAVIEVGMGGRLDSTNVIVPALSIITSIGLDHMEFLGNSIEQIAREKGGIIKPEVPVVMCGVAPEAKGVLVDMCQAQGVNFEVSSEIWRCESQQFNFDRQRLQMKNNRTGESFYLETDLLGISQGENIGVVLCATAMLRKLGCDLKREHVLEGIQTVVKRTGLMGRWQWLRRGLDAEGKRQTAVVCDTGHNSSGWRNVMRQVKRTPYNALHMVVGVVNDKDLTSMLPLLPTEATYYFTKASVPRALDSAILQEKCLDLGLKGEHYPTVHQAISEAMRNAGPEDLVFVGGSTFVVADALTYEFKD